jgi:cytochrome c553
MLVAFLRSQPAIKHDTPPRDLGFMALLLIGGGLFPTSAQPPITQPITRPPVGVTPEYGKYLVDTNGCADCHGPGLTGRQPGGFGPPAGPNLTQLVPKWTEAQYMAFFSTGTDPAGHKVSEFMPWEEFRQALDDNELRAMYAYLRTMPAAPGPAQ